MQTERPHAIALMSGGLDSTLAAKLILDQGVRVTGLYLLSPFGCSNDVARVAESLGISLVVRDKGERYLDLVKEPKYGYGSAMNPCIDCRIYMFEIAEAVRHEEAADFIVTGEVVGQRPMSQHKHSMGLIDRKSDMENRILRPLSAHHFDPTLAEQKGWVDRNKLLNISGRSRKEQLQLAEELKLEHYTPPGGGCLLTEQSFATRLKDFFGHDSETRPTERLAQSQMLRLGRHFRISNESKAIISRNEQENGELEKLWKPAKAVFFYPENFKGPVGVGVGEITDGVKHWIGQLIARFGKSRDAAGGKAIAFEGAQTQGKFIVTEPISEELISTWRI